MSGRGEIEDSARDEQEERPDLEALEDARIEKGPLPLSMDVANLLDMQTQRKCREAARQLRELARGHRFEGTVDVPALVAAAERLEEKADHITAVWE